MTFWGTAAQLLRRYWLDLLCLVSLVAISVAYGRAYFRALRPRAGTLEWIALYDRPAFAIAGRWKPLTRRDAIQLPPVALAAAGLWLFAAWRSFRMLYPDSAPPAGLVLDTVIFYGLLPMITAVAVYCLIRGLSGSAEAALMGTLTLSLDLSADATTLLFVSLVLLFLLRYLTAEAERTFGAACGPLLLAFALAAVGCYFRPVLLLWAAAALLLLLAGCLGRLRELGRGWILKSLLAATAAFGVTLVLAYLPAARMRGLAFPRVFLSADFYRLIGARLAGGLQLGFRPERIWPVLMVDFPVVIGGLAAALVSLLGLVRRPDFRGLVPGALWLFLAALWLLGGVYALSLGGALCLGCVLAGIHQRGEKWLFWVGASLLPVILIVRYAVSWVFR